jgi:hypothetical protein
MKCANCEGVTNIITLGDDGETFTLHLHDTEGEAATVLIDRKEFDRLDAALRLQKEMNKVLSYEKD